jgi:phosphatidylinositol alpha 1,6-mannosyltransferase
LTTPLVDTPPRIVYFTDTFDEANGVATLSRELVQFAQRRGFPLLVIRGGTRTCLSQDGPVETLELKRGFGSFPVDKSLYYDPFFARHKQVVIDHLLRFKPDLLHITAPGDVGILSVWVAHTMQLPSCASWHTNLHEYLARRMERMLSFAPQGLRARLSHMVEAQTLRVLLRFYRSARFTLAPNQTMVDLLHKSTGRPSFLMPHGVDLTRYSPSGEPREADRPFCIGYVGRLTTEKNVRLFAELDNRLRAAGETKYKFLIVGDGGQQQWLQAHLRSAEMTGVLRGDSLAEAYRRMDAFVFPSLTDTFGLVILEAMASGVPVILSPETGARVGVQNGVSGFLSKDFAASIQRLIHDRALSVAMGGAARQFAVAHGWDDVFDDVYHTCEKGLALIAQNNRNNTTPCEGTGVENSVSRKGTSL